MTPHPVTRYMPLLIAGDLHGLRELFGNVPRVNDPRLGWVEGARFEAFVVASHEGLSERSARVEHLATTTTALGAVEECVLVMLRNGVLLRLPVALAAGISADTLESVRVYHSMVPLMGAHAVRSPILPALPALVLPDVIGRFHEHLEKGDIAGLVRQFAPRGQVREPSGLQGRHQGAVALRRFFERLLGRGGIRRERCALTDDGQSCVLEYNVIGWGGAVLRPQAGLAVYERADTGLLLAARIYDDVEPPPMPN